VGGTLLPGLPREAGLLRRRAGDRSRRWRGRTSAASSPTTSRSPVRPSCRFRPPSSRGGDGTYEVKGVLRQAQAGPPLLLDVPIVVQTAGKPLVPRCGRETAETPFTVKVAARPFALHVDPSFDRLPAPRSPRDPVLDRADLRRAADPGRPAVEGSGCRAGGLAEAGRRLEEREPPAGAEDGRRGRRAAEGRARCGFWGGRTPLAAEALRFREDYRLDGQGARGRRGADASRRALGGDRAPPPREPREGDRAGSSRTARKPCPASGASCRTTASTRTSASRERSRRTC